MKTLSIVVPVYNEKNRIVKTLRTLLKGFSFRGLKLKEVVFVDDGSTDITKKIIISHKPFVEKSLKAKVLVVSYNENRGKGYAVKQGMLASTADYTLLMDCDMSTPLDEIGKFIPFMKKDVPVIIGTRKNGKSTVITPQPLYRQLLGKGFTLLSNVILGIWVTDFTCGFKAFSRDAKNEIFSKTLVDGWGYDSEALYLAHRLSIPVAEVAVKWSDDKRTKVNLAKDVAGSLFELFSIRKNDIQGYYVDYKGFQVGYVRKFRFAK